MERIKQIKLNEETITIYHHGPNDFSLCYNIEDCSLRGTLEDVKQDLKSYLMSYADKICSMMNEIEIK